MLAIHFLYVIICLLMRKIIINRKERYEKKNDRKSKSHLPNY